MPWVDLCSAVNFTPPPPTWCSCAPILFWSFRFVCWLSLCCRCVVQMVAFRHIGTAADNPSLRNAKTGRMVLQRLHPTRMSPLVHCLRKANNHPAVTIKHAKIAARFLLQPTRPEQEDYLYTGRYSNEKPNPRNFFYSYMYVSAIDRACKPRSSSSQRCSTHSPRGVLNEINMLSRKKCNRGDINRFG